MYNEMGKVCITSHPVPNVNDSNISIVNCEFCDNYYENIGFTPNYSSGTAVSSTGDFDLNIINCTFGENRYEGPNAGSAPIRLGGGAEANIINSIIYDNDIISAITCSESGLETIVNMNHNIVEGGLDGVLAGDLIDFTWDEETNWDEDPLYVGEGYFPFSVQEGSPAIDAGTLDLPEGVQLPEYDLAGNARIMGEGIDLGAYEYDPNGSEAGENVISVSSDLIIYPNPLFRSNMRDGQAKILWLGEESLEEMSCVIFNVKGQKIRQINQFEELENGRYFANWNMKDSAGEQVSSGVYFVRMRSGEEYIAQQKVSVIK